MINWNSSALWGIIGLLGGFLVSLLFYHISKPKKTLTYEIKSVALVTKEISQVPDLEIIYQGNKIDSLSSTEIIIVNVGNKIIEENDFASKSPLKLHIDSGKPFFSGYIDNCINNVTDKNMNINLDVQSEDIYIHFEFLPPKSSFNLTIFHTGTLSILGYLKSGQLIDSNQHIDQKTKKLKWCLFFLIAAIGIYLIIKYILPLVLALLVMVGMLEGWSNDR